MPVGHEDAPPGRGVPVVVIVLVAVALFAVAIAAVGGALGDAGDEIGEATDRPAATTSTSSTTAPTTTTTAPPPIPLDALTVASIAEDAPQAYRIVYDIVENTLQRQETWTVRRPYESLVVATRDGELVSGTATSREQLWTYLDDRDAWFAVQPKLHRAAFDLRPAAAMATMIELGLAREVGAAEHAGRGCRVFEVAETLGSGNLSELGGAESTTACIDAAGLVLHERWSINGDLVLERAATSVEIDPPIDPAIFDPTPFVEGAPELDVLLKSVAVDADEETLAALRTDVAIPPGYTFDGAVFRANTSEVGGPVATEVVRFHSMGPDLIELAEITVPGGATLTGGSARPIELEGFDEAWFDPDFRASTIRARINDTSFVELRGSSPALLLELLRSISLR